MKLGGYLLKTGDKICPFYIPSNKQIGPSKKRCNLGLKYYCMTSHKSIMSLKHKSSMNFRTFNIRK